MWFIFSACKKITTFNASEARITTFARNYSKNNFWNISISGVNFAQFTIQTFKDIAVWQVKNYVNKMQEKDSKITMVWEKIIPVNGLCTWKKTLINGQSHWKNESKAHTGPVNYTWIYTVFERISVGKTSLGEYGVLSYLVKFGEVSMAYQWPLELWKHDNFPSQWKCSE